MTSVGNVFGGILFTVLIIFLWLLSIFFLLSHSVDNTSFIQITISIIGRTILHTGMFILSHDAMHLNLAPGHKSINVWIGRTTTWLYAFLPYDQCLINHKNHHHYPGQLGDPDFHDGIHVDPFTWYMKFIGEYLSIQRMMIFFLNAICLGYILCVGFKVSLVNIVLFVVLPLCLSSIQLFWFGTYLPHKSGLDQQLSNIQIKPPFIYLAWSFISCYHFGCYHVEHHRNPHKPWYLLPNHCSS